MTENKNVCPCCPRHCDLSAPSCGRGEEYARTGVIPEKKAHGEQSRQGGEDHRHGDHDHEGHRHHGERGEHGNHGEHGDHRGHEDRRDYGEKGEHRHHGEHGDCERSGEKGKCHGHGEHGRHGNLMASPHYAESDDDGKLFAILQELGHFCRFSFEGKGGQGRILHILEKSGDMSQKELTERIGIQPGSASEVLGKLERAGYIVREPGEEDKRTFTVRLTQAGSARASELKDERAARLKEAFSTLSGEEKEQMIALAEKLYGAWMKP